MDDLTMDYTGNRVSNVTAAGQGSMGFRQTGSGVFAYDDAGNISFDALRGVKVTYNALSLPRLIEAADGTVITIVYDATGNNPSTVAQDRPLRNHPSTYCSGQVTPYNGPATERKYYSGLEVVDGAFFQLQHSQGRYVYEIGNDPSYFEYVITDHLSTKGLRNNKFLRIAEVVLCANKAKNVGIVELRRGFLTQVACKRTRLNE